MMMFSLLGVAIIAFVGIAFFAVFAALFRSAKRGGLAGRSSSTSPNANSSGSTWDPTNGGIATSGFSSDASGISTGGSSDCGDSGSSDGGGCGGGDGGGGGD